MTPMSWWPRMTSTVLRNRQTPWTDTRRRPVDLGGRDIRVYDAPKDSTIPPGMGHGGENGGRANVPVICFFLDPQYCSEAGPINETRLGVRGNTPRPDARDSWVSLPRGGMTPMVDRASVPRSMPLTTMDAADLAEAAPGMMVGW